MSVNLETAKVTVMVVEDDFDCRESVCEVLRYDGYHVVAASNGVEALRYLEANPPPGLILLDLMMPVMNGWQFMDERKARPALAQIPVALLSAERDLAGRAAELGVAGYICKPLDVEGLLGTVRKLVGAPA
jgi:CheY-like chemotaxis protein